MLGDDIYTDYFQYQPVYLYALSRRGIALVTSNKLLDAEYKPCQVRNSYRSSTQLTRHPEIPKSFYCRVSHLRPKDMQDPRHNRHSEDTIHQEI